jgi:thiol-disulfide isomerase/thioredoxin
MHRIVRSSIAMLVVLTLLSLVPELAAAPATQPALNWGDAAPPLKVAKWLKGTPIEHFEPGKTYVVEFWATWCGPCKAAMPHLSELARKYEGKITFIGVDVWESGADPLPTVEQFVNGETGQSMKYSVAADSPPTRDGEMAKSWLAAAGMAGIPATFVVRDGKVVWTGHPDNVAPVLEQIVNNTYDMAGTLRAARARDAEGERITNLVRSATEKLKAKDYAGVLAVADSDEGKALTDRAQEWVQRAKFAALLHTDEAKAREFGREVAATTKNTIHMPRMMGLIIVDTAEEGVSVSRETYALGAEWLDGAFAKAPALAGNPDFSLARAACHFASGDTAKALALTVDAAKTNGELTSDSGAKRAPKIEELAKKYAAAAGVPVPAEATATAQRTAQKRVADSQAERAKIKLYDESADAKQQIAAALATAKQNNHRVLIQWGGNWCTWCLRLHEVMSADKDIQRALANNYEVVLIDTAKPAQKNMDLLASYGADMTTIAFPHLTVLDAAGKVLVNQPTGKFENGTLEQGQDPKKVLAFLNEYAANPMMPASGNANAAASAAAAPVATAELKLISPGASEKLDGYTPIRAELGNEKPPTVTKLPADVTAPVFGELGLRGREGAHYHVVFDLPKGKQPRLFADSNGDGDLTNDPPAQWKLTREAQGKKPPLYEGGATFDLGSADRPMPVHIELYCEGNSFHTVYRRPDYATEGKLALEGKSYAVMLNDAACTGDFSGSKIDPADSFAVHPQLLIDLDGDGKFGGKGEAVNVNKPLKIGDATYKLADIAKDGTSFKLIKGDADAIAAGESRAPSAMRDGRTRAISSAGKPFELAFTDAISGKTIDLQRDLKGKIVVLDFWATWCGPCVAEMPANKEIYARYKDKGVEFIGISLDNPDDKGGLRALKKYCAENQITWPQYHLQGKGGNPTFARDWGVTSIPSVFLVDADGKLYTTDARGKLETMIPDLLARRDGKSSAAAPTN